MKRLQNLWENFKTGFWFPPSIIVTLSVVLAFASRTIDQADAAGTFFYRLAIQGFSKHDADLLVRKIAISESALPKLEDAKKPPAA